MEAALSFVASDFTDWADFPAREKIFLIRSVSGDLFGHASQLLNTLFASRPHPEDICGSVLWAELLPTAIPWILFSQNVASITVVNGSCDV